MRWADDSLVNVMGVPASAQMVSAARGTATGRATPAPGWVCTTSFSSTSRAWSSVSTVPSSSTMTSPSPSASTTAPSWAPEARTRLATRAAWASRSTDIIPGVWA